MHDTVSKRAFLKKIKEYDIVEIRQLAGYFDLTYGATATRLHRYKKRGLLEPMFHERGKYCITDKGIEMLYYLTRERGQAALDESLRRLFLLFDVATVRMCKKHGLAYNVRHALDVLLEMAAAWKSRELVSAETFLWCQYRVKQLRLDLWDN